MRQVLAQKPEIIDLSEVDGHHRYVYRRRIPDSHFYDVGIITSDENNFRLLDIFSSAAIGVRGWFARYKNDNLEVFIKNLLENGFEIFECDRHIDLIQFMVDNDRHLRDFKVVSK